MFYYNRTTLLLIPNKIYLTQSQRKIELDGEENSSFSKFLDRKNEKLIKLDRILGIGGEGIVLRDEIWTREFHYETQLGKKEKKKVAVKFVEFEKKDGDDFDAPEEAQEADEKYGEGGGMNDDGYWVKSKYFQKMWENLGDFVAATDPAGGYVTPYLDFAISEIHKKFFFIIGKLNS